MDASRLYTTNDDWLLDIKPWIKSNFSIFHRLEEQLAYTICKEAKHFSKPSAPKATNNILYVYNFFNGYRSP